MSQPPPQHGDSWTCPVTGLVIPKLLADNLKWRERLRAEARHNEAMQEQLRAACAASPWFWINAFVWTFRQKVVGADGQERPVSGHEAHYPFITWKVQDEFIGELIDCIDGGHDVLINKSRDMGATWLCVTIFHWYWQFKRGVTFLELSRKQQLVDRRGDMDSLFEKHRYILKWQPAFLRPRRVRDNICHLENVDNGNTIEGESTNEHAGQGGRKTAILLDEFARVPNGEEIDLATADTTACRIFNSTPAGPGTQFTKIFNERRARILHLPWWRHPDKGRGAHQIIGENGQPKWTSPWYEIECQRRSRRDIAQNLDCDHGQAGDVFFPYIEIERHRLAHQREPLIVGDLRPDAEYTDDGLRALIRASDYRRIILARNVHGSPWRFYIPLVDGRLPQDWTYVMGVDVANGSGASNSVISVLAHEPGMIVAKFWSAHVSPEQLAVICALAGVWIGGSWSPPFVIWEVNGPGVIFGKKFISLGYTHYYYQRLEGKKGEDQTAKWGWSTNRQRKEMLLGKYRDALAHDNIIVPCRESLDECLDYIYDDAGRLIPGKWREEPEGGQSLHGDHVIADALTLIGREELPRFRERAAQPPPGSYGWIALRNKRRLARQDVWSV